MLSIKKVFLVGIFVVERCWEEDSNDSEGLKAYDFSVGWNTVWRKKGPSVLANDAHTCQCVFAHPPPPASFSLEMHTPPPPVHRFHRKCRHSDQLKTVSRVETLEAEPPWTATSSSGSSPRRFSTDAILKSDEDPEEWGGGWRVQWKRSL